MASPELRKNKGITTKPLDWVSEIEFSNRNCPRVQQKSHLTSILEFVGKTDLESDLILKRSILPYTWLLDWKADWASRNSPSWTSVHTSNLMKVERTIISKFVPDWICDLAVQEFHQTLLTGSFSLGKIPNNNWALDLEPLLNFKLEKLYCSELKSSATMRVILKKCYSKSKTQVIQKWLT